MIVSDIDTLGVILTQDNPRCMECGDPVERASKVDVPCTRCIDKRLSNLLQDKIIHSVRARPVAL